MGKLRNNEEVPIECILRQVVREREQLKREVAYLKEQLSQRDNAIKSFKKWQTRVADYKLDYWKSEGKKLMSKEYDKFPSLEFKILHLDNVYKTHLYKLNKCVDKIREIQKQYESTGSDCGL